MIRIDLLRYGARRHPLLRLVFGLIGLILLAMLSVVALAVGVVALVVWLARRYLQGRRAPSPLRAEARPAAATQGVIEGEYRVVSGERNDWAAR